MSFLSNPYDQFSEKNLADLNQYYNSEPDL